MKDSQLLFVLPTDSEAISGGNRFNQKLLDALSAQGNFSKIGAGQWAQNRQGAAGVCIVDTLNLSEFASVYPWRDPKQRFVLLVHHLASLEPGVDRECRVAVEERAILALFDGFIATSEYAAEVLRSFGLSQPCLVLQPSLNPQLQRSTVPISPVFALMACNLLPRKGVLEFLRGLSSEVRAEDTFTLQIVGRLDMDPSYVLECRRYTAMLEGKVQLRGALPYEKMPDAYQAANLFLSASKMETFGISLQEARHCGVPILVVCGGNSENHVQNGVTGQSVASPEELARVFVHLVRHPHLLQNYWQNAQAEVRELGETWEELALRLRGALRDWFGPQ